MRRHVTKLGGNTPLSLFPTALSRTLNCPLHGLHKAGVGLGAHVDGAAVRDEQILQPHVLNHHRATLSTLAPLGLSKKLRGVTAPLTGGDAMGDQNTQDETGDKENNNEGKDHQDHRHMVDRRAIFLNCTA